MRCANRGVKIVPLPEEQSDREELAKLRERQQNVLWPDLLRASRDTDEVLHKVGAKPLIQRLVGWVVGACVMFGAANIVIGFKSGWLSVAFGTALFVVGAHAFWVACKSGTKQRKDN